MFLADRGKLASSKLHQILSRAREPTRAYALSNCAGARTPLRVGQDRDELSPHRKLGRHHSAALYAETEIAPAVPAHRVCRYPPPALEGTHLRRAKRQSQGKRRVWVGGARKESKSISSLLLL
jgi:hypothetical protein